MQNWHKRLSKKLFTFFKKETVKKGRNVLILSRVHWGGFNTIDHFSILEGGNINVGRFTTISSHCVFRGPIDIGNYTQIGPNVLIFSRNHPASSLSINTSREFLKGGRKKLQKDLQHTVRIGSDVWIGAGVTILAGADIGDGSIIASGAVVKGNVEPFTIVAGIPAKKIKNRFEKDIVNKLMRIKWWLRSDEFIQTHRKLFMIPEITLEDLEIFE